MKKPKVLKFGGQKVLPGDRMRISIEVGALYDYTPLHIPIEVVRGKKEGPIMFICAAIHGDEINGVEIIKRVLKKISVKKIHGTLICVPVVNVFGFNNKSRYLPDRRDLNRSFPGNAKGSLASQIAHIFMKEIVRKCTHGIDLHTGSLHKTNLPQIRACLGDEDAERLAKSFGVPVVMNANLRDGSLREAARQKKICTLLYEGGEALRFDESVIKIGVRGCFSVMREIGMLKPLSSKNSAVTPKLKTYVSQSSFWVRAPHSGSFVYTKKVGDHVQEGDVVAIISDPFGKDQYEVTCPDEGIIVGGSTIPLVNRGDAIMHVALFTNANKVGRAIVKEFAKEKFLE